MPKKATEKPADDTDDGDDAESDDDDKPQPRAFDLIHTGKLGLFVFLLFALLMSDVFIERVMARSGIGLVEGRVPTTRGIVVQGIILVIGLVVLDLLITNETL